MTTNHTATATHCESCGSTDPEDIGHAALRENDGYSACCNERVCDGHHADRFGIPGQSVTACCWSRAEVKFGGWDKVPEGASRLG